MKFIYFHKGKISVMSKYERIFLDLDGVITDWSGEVCKKLQINFNDPKIRHMLKHDLPFEEQAFSGGREEFVKLINELGYDFWHQLPLLPWASTIYDLIKSIYGEDHIFFLTSHTDFPFAPQAKVDYVKDWFNSDRIVVTKYKNLFSKPGVILIDDMMHNKESFVKEGGDVFLWPNQWKIIDGDVSLDYTMKDLENQIT